MDETVQSLKEIGFTQTQARIYVALIRTGETDAKTLEKIVRTPNQVIYRALNELQRRGIVEKKIASPLQFKAVPINQAIEIILREKANEFNNTFEKSKKVVELLKQQKVSEGAKHDFNITIIETRQAIVSKSELANQSVEKTVDCCSTFQRLTQMGQEIRDTIKKRLDSGVKYRVILEKSLAEVCLPQELNNIVYHKNCQVKITSGKLKINAAVFDGKYASFNFYPSKSFTESPMVWTNHPAIVTGFEYYFLDKWRHSVNVFQEYEAVP